MRARHFLALAAVSLFAAFGPPERTTQAKWALVVGISDYIHFDDEVGGDLPGAANDARAVADVLVNRHGFSPDNVKLVLDHAATRERLRAELSEWLPSVARPGDLVWFYFAGHGSQAWDVDGDEDDGLDETVCPADVTRGSTEYDILDDEIGQWLGQLPTGNVIVVWDKCHARSSTRAVTPFARPRSLGRDLAEDVPRPDAALTAARDADTPEDGGLLGEGILEIAAAQADEVAIDAAFPGGPGGAATYGGAFTTPFVRNLWNAPDGATYDDIFSRTRADMRRNRFRQDPSIDEKPLKDRPLFWLEDGTPAADLGPTGAIRVLDLPTGATATLSGGLNADMTVGSVYSAGGDLLEVTRVHPDRAETRIAGAPAGELAVGSTARLVAYRYPDAVLRVTAEHLPEPATAALRRALRPVPSLMLVEDATSFAHLLVRSRNEHHVVLNLDGFPRDSVPAGDIDGLAHVLEREAGQFQLAALENPARPFPVDFAFGNGRSSFVLGEEVSFVVTAGRDGYLTIVDLAADGTAAVIFPNDFVSDNRVYAGRTTVFPTPEMDLSFPAVEPTGRGIVRAFVTERPLLIPFTQGEATEAGKIRAALATAAGRPPTDGGDAIPVRSWATAAIVYDIRP